MTKYERARVLGTRALQIRYIKKLKQKVHTKIRHIFKGYNDSFV